MKHGARFEAPDVTRSEEEAIQQAMQDATLREQAQADRERIRQVRALLLSFSADSLSLQYPFVPFPCIHPCLFP